MNSTRYFLIAGALLLSLLLTPQTAEAQLRGRGFPGLGVFGNCYGSSLYSLGRVPVPPYFALHPPVYYSGIRPTTYGSSPFANRPARIPFDVHVMPEQVPAGNTRLRLKAKPVEPKVVANPFVAPGAAPKQRTPIKVIYNPYYEAERAKLLVGRSSRSSSLED